MANDGDQHENPGQVQHELGQVHCYCASRNLLKHNDYGC